MELVVVTPEVDPPPIAPAELQAHVNVEAGVDEGVLAGYLRAACSWAEQYTGWAVTPTEYLYSAGAFPRGRELRLPRPPLLSVEVFEYWPADGDAVAVPEASYETVTVGRWAALELTAGAAWPEVALRPPGVTVRFTAGFSDSGALPGSLRQGILLLAGHWYQTREAVVIGEAGMRAQEVPFGVKAALDMVRLL